MKNILIRTLFSILMIIGFSCISEKQKVSYDFHNVPDRVWIGEDFWTVPLEDWKVKNGRIETNSRIQNASVSLLPYVLTDKKESFTVSVKMGLLSKGENDGSSGLTIGAEAKEEKDVRAAVYFGTGMNAGINTKGFAFIGTKTGKLPDDFNMSSFRLELQGEPAGEKFKLTLKISDDKGRLIAEVINETGEKLSGIIKLTNNIIIEGSRNNGPVFWFDDLSLEGSKIDYQPENCFGPVLWTMYTLSRNTLKMTAQLPPVESGENREAVLQIREENKWTNLQAARMDPDARTVTWKIEKWDQSKPKDYRISFNYIDAFGKKRTSEYEGHIRKEPDGPGLRLGALTCQYHYGFPYSPLVKNLELSKPDLLYFSGDQIYEQNGGYPIRREPEDVAILSYLGKWYMFGWAFGDLMRNIPAICTPDDHDVFHGNLWGEGGAPAEPGLGNTRGFLQTIKMVNAVNRTNCAHLPDPYDPSPGERGMSVWYTSLNYGRVSFAIVSDRVFKTSATRVVKWKTRPDHLLSPLKNPGELDRPDLKLLGDRQEKFLEEWIRDWNNVDMKVLLSQTLYANAATHHGNYDGFILGDLDSGGWPKTARDRAIGIMRKGFVFHVAGDQHVSSIVQYGIDQFRDAGWSFVTPAIAVGYSRWFRPDDLKIKVTNRPEHNYPNTGEYVDGFGNKNYVYAIGNPPDFSQLPNRYELAEAKGSGYGMINFDTGKRTITMESWRYLANVSNPAKADQYPGWPFTISQFDNYGRKSAAWLPTIKVEGEDDPVLEVTNENTGELEYIVRINGKEYKPGVFSPDSFMIKVGYPEKNIWKEFKGLKPVEKADKREITVKF